ncbi:MAG: hypothetical protein RQ733_09175 [Methyloprofundus sp.]|nr:hypothetical protein [Methyloprofundus sp.]MDT8426131.1 hypothetical protein [Methyloprofundus sp.]
MRANYSPVKTVVFTGLALLSFAANSVLCRLGWGAEAIDAASFTAVRLLSGAIVLDVIRITHTKKALPEEKGSWLAG